MTCKPCSNGLVFSENMWKLRGLNKRKMYESLHTAEQRKFLLRNSCLQSWRQIARTVDSTVADFLNHENDRTCWAWAGCTVVNTYSVPIRRASCLALSWARDFSTAWCFSIMTPIFPSATPPINACREHGYQNTSHPYNHKTILSLSNLQCYRSHTPSALRNVVSRGLVQSHLSC